MINSNYSIHQLKRNSTIKLLVFILALFISLNSFSQTRNLNSIRKNIGLQFRGSQNLNDTINKTDFSLFVFQFGGEYDLTANNKLLSVSPNLNAKFGLFFFLTTGIKGGLTVGINDKLKTNFPLGFQFTLDYDINYNRFNKTGEYYLGWCPESSVTIKVSKETLLRLSYGLTLIPNNNNNFIHNITIGFSGLNDF